MLQNNFYTGSGYSITGYGMNSNIIKSRIFYTGSQNGLTPTSELIKEFLGYPIQTAYTLAGNAINWKWYGNSKQEYITIDGVQYKIPTGYTVLDYIESTGTQYIQLNYGFDNTKDEIILDSQIEVAGTDKFMVAPMTWNTDSNRFAMAGLANSANPQRAVGYGNTSTSNTVYSPSISANTNRATETYSNYIFTYNDGTNEGTCDTSTVTFGSVTTNLRLFYGYNSATIGKFYSWVHKRDGAYIEVLVPMKNSSNVLGMYDFVSNTFFTNAGSGIFTAGNTAPCVDQPIDVVSVGDKTANLYTRVGGTYTSSDKGSVTSSNNITTVNVLFASAWSIYKLSGAVNSTSIATSLTEMKSKSTDDALFKSGKTYIIKLFDSSSDYYDLQIANTTANMEITDGVAFTPSVDYNSLWVRMSSNSQSTGNHIFKVMIVEGSTAPTSYIPYGYAIPTVVTNNGVATTTTTYLSEPLRKVGTYADYIDYENQRAVRNVGSYTFTGNESWQASSTSNCFYWTCTNTISYVKSSDTQMLWTAYAFSETKTGSPYYPSETNKFNVYIDTYNNIMELYVRNNDCTTVAEIQATTVGTTIYYPLATPTTETITVPALTLAEGTDNITTNTVCSPSDGYLKCNVSRL